MSCVRRVAFNHRIYTVVRIQIIGTQHYVYSAWLPCYLRDATYSEVTTFGDGPEVSWYGRVGTERIPPELDAIPINTKERSNAVHAFRQSRNMQAVLAISAAFPGILGRAQRIDSGEIEVFGDAINAALVGGAS